MKRLREIEPQSELQRTAKQLVGSVEPLPPSPERMARVRRRLDEPSGAGLLVAFRRLPAVVIAGAIALFGASAFAAVRVFVEVRQAQAVEAARQEAREQAARMKRAPRKQPATAIDEAAPEAPAPQAPDVLVPAPAAAPEQPAAEAPAATAHERSTARGVQRPRVKAPARTPERTPEEEQAEAVVHDSELVHRAVKALRRDGNPALAARLLDEDRIRNPRGPLAEEALSLRIEAALALRDDRARSFAEQYIGRYPAGRYLSIARRALSEGAAK